MEDELRDARTAGGLPAAASAELYRPRPRPDGFTAPPPVTAISADGEPWRTTPPRRSQPRSVGAGVPAASDAPRREERATQAAAHADLTASAGAHTNSEDRQSALSTEMTSRIDVETGRLDPLAFKVGDCEGHDRLGLLKALTACVTSICSGAASL